MTITEQVAKNIIRRLLNAEDYRIEIITLIDAEFLQSAINYFKKVAHAKISNQDITADWYKSEFSDDKPPKEDIAINSGLREIVVDAENNHYDALYESIKDLTDSRDGLELTLISTLKFQGVGVDLNISETLIVISMLAVKRAALRRGLWSVAGKRVAKPLMQTLCKLYGVSDRNYKSELVGSEVSDRQGDYSREVDFYLIKDNSEHKCEVKLMGKGNPESADAVFARGSKVFIADKLSDTNKSQLDDRGVEWVELRATDGFQRFKRVLERLEIPFTDITPENLEADIDRIFDEIF